MRQFVSLKTAAEMAAESKKATEDGLRAVAEALSRIDATDSDSDENRHTDPDRYLQLELANAKVDIINLREDLDGLKEKFQLFVKINNDLDHLGNLHHYTNNLDTLSYEQLEKKLVLYTEEENEHAKLCMNYITKIDLPYIKRAMTLTVISYTKMNITISEKLRNAINNKWRVRQIELWMSRFGVCLIIVLLAVVWAQKIEVVSVGH
jgi:predicted AlkP superfamily phosphohydrolase/phosphomutase